MDDRLSGASPPEQAPDGRLRVAIPGPGATLDLTICTTRIVGVYYHWTYAQNSRKGRAALCTDDDACELHATHGEANWQGWIAGVVAGLPGLRAVSMTYHAACLLLNLVSSGETIRGRRVRMIRSGHDARGPITWELHGSKPQPIPKEEPDLWLTLVALYGERVLLYRDRADRRAGK